MEIPIHVHSLEGMSSEVVPLGLNQVGGGVGVADSVEIGQGAGAGGAAIPDAVRMATATPAAIMGWRDRGALLLGMLADFVLFDEDIRCLWSSSTESWSSGDENKRASDSSAPVAVCGLSFERWCIAG